MNYRLWTDFEKRRFTQMRAAGLPYRECASALDRSFRSVKAQARKLGLMKTRPLGQKTDRRLQVRSLHARGFTVRQMVRVLSHCGGSSAQLHRDHREMKLTPHRSNSKPQKPWGNVL